MDRLIAAHSEKHEAASAEHTPGCLRGLQGQLVRFVTRVCSPSSRMIGVASESWTETRELLRCLRLEHYATALEREEVLSIASLSSLNHAQLVLAGVKSLGARTAMLDAAKGLCALVDAARAPT